MVTVREARDAYLRRSRLSTSSYRARWLVLRVGWLVLPVPNQRVLHWHDLHHIATGFPTGLLGEAEISAYELRIAHRPPLITLLCVASIVMCATFAPRRLLRAWRRAEGCRGLYGMDDGTYERLLELPLDELRRRLGMPAEGLA